MALDVPQAQRRENPESYEVTQPIPWFMVGLVGCLMAVGIAYIVESNVDTPSELRDGLSLSELSRERPASGAKVNGTASFATACVACHQATGTGLPGVFPPPAGSEWVNGKEATLAATDLHGINGSINLKGAPFTGAMPAFKEQFSDEQLDE
jgi:mono/diheme cytochrome c family protein